MSLPIDYIKSILHYFLYEFYPEGVRKVRKEIKQQPAYKDNWESIVRLILNKELKKGQALDLIHNTANLPLYKNTEEEAYRWLTLMLINVASEEGTPVLDYKEICAPENDEK